MARDINQKPRRRSRDRSPDAVQMRLWRRCIARIMWWREQGIEEEALSVMEDELAHIAKRVYNRLLERGMVTT